MKYSKYLIGIGFSLLFLIFILNISAAKSVSPYTKRFVFVAPISWNTVAAGINAADQEFGTNTKLVGSKALNMEGMLQEMETAIATEADGIITAGVFSTPEMYEVIEKAERMGIPVVILDSDLPESTRSAYVGTDNYEAGIASGEAIAEAAGGGARIGVVVSELTAANQQERLDGLYSVVERSPDMQVVEVLECHSNYLEIAEKLSLLLQEHPEVDTLCFLEGRAGSCFGGILEKRTASGRKLTVIAFDASEATLEYVDSGLYYSTIVQKQYEEGYKAVETLYHIVQGTPQSEAVYTDVLSIKAENLDSLKKASDEGLVWHYY